MLHRTLLTTFSILTLATCQSQKTANSKIENSTKSTSTSTSVSTTAPKATTSPSTNTNRTVQNNIPKKTGDPQMSTGLPPDKQAIEIAKKEAAQAAAANSGSVIYFKEGENKFLKQYEMNVTFKQMSEDSRCPKDVNCIWAGVATADVELMGLATRPVTLKISTMNDANKGYARTQSFNGYNVSLVSVTPETTSDKGFKALKGSYKIGLKFEKSTAATGGTTTR